MSRNPLLKSIIVLTVICLVISAALAVVNGFTAPVIEQAQQERETASRQQVLPSATEFEPLSLELLPDSVSGAYLGLDNGGNVVGYVFTAANRGFDGTIVVMTAIGADGRIVNVSTIDVTSETKTLGGQTANESYTKQYIGQDASLADVDAISCATITSTAYEQCVLDSFAAYEIVKEG